MGSPISIVIEGVRTLLFFSKKILKRKTLIDFSHQNFKNTN